MCVISKLIDLRSAKCGIAANCWVTTPNGNTVTRRRPDTYTRNLIPSICVIIDIYQDKYYGVVFELLGYYLIIKYYYEKTKS